MSKPLKAFITYSHKDLQRNTELQTRLAVMEDEGKIKLWDDNKILPSDEWEKDISENLAESDILLYLVSATSLASKNCNKELAEVLNLNIKVIAIVLEACDWENHQLSRFEVLPHKGKPINEWRPQSKGWQNVVTGIRKVVDKMQSQVDSPPGAPEEELRAESAFQQGNVLMMLEQTDEAVERYSHAIELNPNYTYAYSNRGVAYTNIDDLDYAISDYTKAIYLDPNYVPFYIDRGLLYRFKGDEACVIEDEARAIKYYDRAIEDFNKVIQLDPNHAMAHTHRGVVYRKKGDFFHAIVDSDTAIQLDIDNPQAYDNLDAVWLHLKEWEKAKSDLMTVRSMGVDIVALFHLSYSSVVDFEQRNGVKLPADIAAMLTPQQ